MGDNGKKKCGLPPAEAIILAEEVKKLLICHGIWCKVQEVHEDGLAFINVEASIKVQK